jgi:hypothetical protein
MTADATVVAGVIVPSTSPVFLAVVGAHVIAGIVATASGAAAMLSRKGPGRHPRWGKAYYWSLVVVVGLATGVAAARWVEDSQLAALGWAALASATVGRLAARMRRPGWARIHLPAMGSSYVLLLTAFYVDNGRFLPVWRDLSPAAYWLGPAAIGVPIMLVVARRHPPIRR